MKQFFTLLGAVLTIAGTLAIVLLVSSVSAQTPQPSGTTMVLITPIPQNESTAAPLPAGWNMTMQGNGNGGMKGGRMGMHGGMSGGSQMTAGGGMMHSQASITTTGSATNGTASMMTGIIPMHEDVAYALGMTSQDLYNQMATGKSMVQVAAEKGLTEQQLMNTIMQGRQMAYAQAMQNGTMTQAQAEAMLQHVNDNLQMWVNDQGTQSTGWSMMWGE